MTHAIRATASNHPAGNDTARRAAALCLLGLAGAALAIGTARANPYTHTLANGVTVTVTGTGPNTAAPFDLDNLEQAQLGAGTYTRVPGLTITATTNSQSGVYQGAVSGYAASPFAPPGGAPPTTGPTHYLVAQANSGTVTMTYASAQTGFDLLWGTVDVTPSTPDASGKVWNQLSFGTGSDTYTVTGRDIAPGLASRDGSYKSGSLNAWVQIVLPTNVTFTTVTASDNLQPAFELVPGHRGNAVTNAPEPGSLALLATALLGLGLIRRRRA